MIKTISVGQFLFLLDVNSVAFVKSIKQINNIADIDSDKVASITNIKTRKIILQSQKSFKMLNL